MRAWCWVLLLSAAGCSGNHAAYEKQVAQINEKIMILQNERDRLEERIAVLEQERGQARPPQSNAVIERPRLKVVQLRPEGDPPVGEQPGSVEVEPMTGARTLIQGSGSAISQVPIEETD